MNTTIQKKNGTGISCFFWQGEEKNGYCYLIEKQKIKKRKLNSIYRLTTKHCLIIITRFSIAKWEAWEERSYTMYEYVNDKQFLSNMRSLCGNIMQDLCHTLKEEYDIGTSFYLVGSGAKNLIMRNANRPIDLDYNLEITRIDDWDDCRKIKECVRKAFNAVLQKHRLDDCEDSTSSLTTKKKRHFIKYNDPSFSIDVCIVCEDEGGNYYRLIHEKTGFSYYDKYFWNQAPNSRRLKEKVDYIKRKGKWILVREQYKRIKNKYLTSNDYNHSSFICYIEAVNNVYNSRKHWD